MTPRLTVVVMAFDEATSLEAVVREIQEAVWSLHEPHEILIVDDGSRDSTNEIADRLAAEFPAVRVIHHATNEGLGGVYRTGFQAARGAYVTFFPADGQFPPSIIGKFLPLMEGADMVLGYLPGGGRPGIGGLLSVGERLLYRLLFGRVPRFQGILMFRRTLLDDIALRSQGRGWAVLLELILRAARLGHRLVNVPTDMRPRATGTSKVANFATVWSNLRQAMALRAEL